MSRHRNVRSMNYSEEYDGYDDVYGHSMEDDFAMSPSDAAFMYDRNRQPQMSAFLAEEDDIAEEDETGLEGNTEPVRRNSETYQRPTLSELDEARLRSCLDEIRNVIGDTLSEQVLINTILKHDFNVNKSLDVVLSTATSLAQVDDSQPKRKQERKDPGKDQDVDTTRTISYDENNAMANLKTDIAQLSIVKPVEQIPCSMVDSLLNLKLEQSSALKLPKFQFKKINNIRKENSSDEEDEGSLLALVAKHQKKPMSNMFTSLADLADKHLQTNPIVHNSKSNKIITSFTPVQSNSKNLVDLSAEHLANKSDSLTSKFVIPKLCSSKKCENEIDIDLSSALKPITSRRSKPFLKAAKIKISLETDFIVDHDIEQSIETLNYGANAMNILNINMLPTKELSNFGNVVCRKWRKRRKLLHSKRQRENLHTIIPFDFVTPSPDDLVLRHVRRK